MSIPTNRESSTTTTRVPFPNLTPSNTRKHTSERAAKFTFQYRFKNKLHPTRENTRWNDLQNSLFHKNNQKHVSSKLEREAKTPHTQ